jgi:lysozyme
MSRLLPCLIVFGLFGLVAALSAQGTDKKKNDAPPPTAQRPAAPAAPAPAAPKPAPASPRPVAPTAPPPPVAKTPSAAQQSAPRPTPKALAATPQPVAKTPAAPTPSAKILPNPATPKATGAPANPQVPLVRKDAPAAPKTTAPTSQPAPLVNSSPAVLSKSSVPTPATGPTAAKPRAPSGQPTPAVQSTPAGLSKTASAATKKSADGKPAAPPTGGITASRSTPQVTAAANAAVQAPVRQAIATDPLASQVARYEGIRTTMYHDSLGIPTVGIGFNLNRSDARAHIEALGLNYNQVRNGTQSLTSVQILTLFRADLQTAQNNARTLVPNYDTLPPTVQRVVADMTFNLGASRFGQFVELRRALAARDFAQAAHEMENSRWYHQVGNRGRDLANTMRSQAAPVSTVRR